MRLPLRFVRREKMKAYQVTGNEYVSLPTIHEENGSIEGLRKAAIITACILNLVPHIAL